MLPSGCVLNSALQGWAAVVDMGESLSVHFAEDQPSQPIRLTLKFFIQQIRIAT